MPLPHRFRSFLFETLRYITLLLLVDCREDAIGLIKRSDDVLFTLM